MISTETLHRLRSYDTPTICNVIELFEVRPHNSGYMDSRIAACFPELPAVVGFAATATFCASTPTRERTVYASIDEQIERLSELSGPAIVVVQDLDQPAAAATFGEIMCTTYQSFGAQALITSGAGRDLDQVHALRFPVFTNGTVCSHGYSQTLQVHVAVSVGGLVVHPNDLLHADRNGVALIPHQIACEVADVAGEFVAAEAVILDGLRGAEAPTPRLQRELSAESQSRIAALRARVTRRQMA